MTFCANNDINVENKRRVFFIAASDIYRASSRYRVFNWVPYLERSCIECKILSFFPSNLNYSTSTLIRKLHLQSSFFPKQYKKIIRWSSWADTVVIQETFLPKWLLKKISNSGARIIFDISNPVEFVFSPPSIKWYYYLKLKVFLSRFNTIQKIADYILIENELFKEMINNERCVPIVIKGPVDVNFFKPRDSKINRKYINIGWTGSPVTFDYLKPILPLLDKIGREHPNVKLTLIGAPYRPQLSYISVQVFPWELYEEPKLVADFDIGIYHIPDSPLYHRRGGGKLYIYMASGVPIAASRFGIASQVIKDNNIGFLATSLDDWYEALSTLITNETLRQEMGKEARHQAIRFYSYEAYLPVMLDLLSYKK